MACRRSKWCCTHSVGLARQRLSWGAMKHFTKRLTTARCVWFSFARRHHSAVILLYQCRQPISCAETKKARREPKLHSRDHRTRPAQLACFGNTHRFSAAPSAKLRSLHLRLTNSQAPLVLLLGTPRTSRIALSHELLARASHTNQDKTPTAFLLERIRELACYRAAHYSYERCPGISRDGSQSVQC